MSAFAVVFSLSAAAEPAWDELDRRLDELAKQEKGIIETYDAMPVEHSNPEALVSKLNALMAQLTDEQRAELHKAKSLKDRSKQPPQVQQALALIEEFDKHAKPFQERYFKHNQERLAFLSDFYWRMAEDLVAAAKEAGVSPKSAGKLDETLKALRDHHQKFQTKIGENDAARDKWWMNNFFDEHRKLLEIAEASGKGLRTWGERRDAIFRRMGRTWNFFKFAASGLPGLPQGILNLGGRKPGITNAEPVMKRVMASQGMKLEIRGADRVPRKPGPNELNIFTLNHTTSAMGGMPDGYTLSKFLGSNPVLVNGGMQGPKPLSIIPDSLWKALGVRERQNPNYLVVGTSDPDPITELLNRRAAGKADALFALPEGNTFEGNGYGLRPWQDGFSIVVLQNLRQRKGLELRVTPMSSPRHFQFWNRVGADPKDRKDLVTIVHEPIEPAAVDVLMLSGDVQRLGRVVTQIWLASLDDNNIGERRLGSPDIHTLLGMNWGGIALAVNCEEVMGRVKGNAAAPATTTLASGGAQ